MLRFHRLALHKNSSIIDDFNCGFLIGKFCTSIIGALEALEVRIKFLTTHYSLLTETKSFPFSALILRCRLFFLRTSAQCASALCSRLGVSSVFTLQAKTEKLKVFRFPLSVFRYSYYLCGMEQVRAKKALGQHFLTDLNIAQKICNSLSGGTTDNPDKVLEVGCGMGVLTQYLLRREDIETYGVDIDTESIAYLHAHYPDFTPRLREGDFLKMDLNDHFPEGVKVIGNFPYNISSQIFFKIIEHRNLVPECVGMIQKEVAERIAEKEGSKTYGILSVLLQAWYDIEYLFTVSEKVFNPPPKVKSAVIRLRRNATTSLDCDEQLFVKVVKASFGQRRKMLRNSLRSAFDDFGGAEHPFFTKRAEQLSVADFVELTKWVAENRN